MTEAIRKKKITGQNMCASRSTGPKDVLQETSYSTLKDHYEYQAIHYMNISTFFIYEYMIKVAIVLFSNKNMKTKRNIQPRSVRNYDTIK